jgi:hypothetical protein
MIFFKQYLETIALKILCFVTRNIGNTMADSRGAKEDENVMHKVGIRLGKRPMIEEQINVEEKSIDEQPNNDVVAPEVVVVAPNVDF